MNGIKLFLAKAGILWTGFLVLIIALDLSTGAASHFAPTQWLLLGLAAIIPGIILTAPAALHGAEEREKGPSNLWFFVGWKGAFILVFFSVLLRVIFTVGSLVLRGFWALARSVGPGSPAEA